MLGTNKKNAEARENAVQQGLEELIAANADELVEWVLATDLQVHPDEYLYSHMAEPSGAALATFADSGCKRTALIAIRGTLGVVDGTVLNADLKMLRLAQSLSEKLPVVWRTYPSALEVRWARLVHGFQPVKRDQDRLTVELALAYRMWEPLAEERSKAGRKPNPMFPQTMGSEPGPTREHVARYFKVGPKMVDASVWIMREHEKLPPGDRDNCPMRKMLREGKSPQVVRRHFETEMGAEPSEEAIKAPVSEVARELGERMKAAVSPSSLTATPAGIRFQELVGAHRARLNETKNGILLPPPERTAARAAEQAINGCVFSARKLKDAIRAHRANLNHAAQTLAAWSAARESATNDPTDPTRPATPPMPSRY